MIKSFILFVNKFKLSEKLKRTNKSQNKKERWLIGNSMNIELF